jgi:hypothetical protein
MGENYTHYSKNKSGHLIVIHLSIVTHIICIGNTIDDGQSHHTFLSYSMYALTNTAVNNRLRFWASVPFAAFLGTLVLRGKAAKLPSETTR